MVIPYFLSGAFQSFYLRRKGENGFGGAD